MHESVTLKTLGLRELWGSVALDRGHICCISRIGREVAAQLTMLAAICYPIWEYSRCLPVNKDFPMYLQHYNNNPNQTHRWAVVKKIASEMEAVLKNYLHCFILFTLLTLPRLLTLLTLLSLLPPRPQPTLLTLHTLLREGSRYQFGWIFGKVPRGGGHFQSKNLYCRFWEL